MADKVTYTANSNPQDVVAVEIGDTKQTDFYPQSKIMRWGNEVNFSLRYVDPNPTLATVSTDVKEAEYVHGDVTVNIYDKPEASDDGGLEFEITLASAPVSNELLFTVRSKRITAAKEVPFTELDLTGQSFYSEDLVITENEVKGVDDFVHLSKAPEAVNAYTLYHDDPPPNFEGGTLYRSGKFLTIYRPKIVDANMVEAWCDQELDLVNETYKIIIPQTFLDTAVYPIKIDPTLGNTSVGLTNSNYLGGAWRTFTTTAPVTARVTSYSAYANAHFNNDQMQFTLRRNAGGDTVMDTFSVLLDDANPGWVTANSVQFPVLQAGSQYQFGTGIEHVNGGSFDTLYWDTVPANQGILTFARNAGTTTQPDFLETGGATYWSQYLTYTEVFKNGYSYRRPITVDATKVDADLTDYPVLISGTYTYLRTVANGGLVTNANGFDIRFELADGTKLDHEIESYNATTGAIVAWVRLPLLNNLTNTGFVMYYGNPNVSTSEANPTGTWSSRYDMVQHLEEDGNTSANGYTDSTSNTRHGTGVNLTAASDVAGAIGTASNFVSGSTQYIKFGDILDKNANSVFSISLYLKINTTSMLHMMVTKNAAGNPGYVVWVTAAEKLSFDFDAGGGKYIEKTLTDTLVSGTWYHYVVTYDGTATLAGTRVYINGVEKTSYSFTNDTLDTTDVINTTTEFNIGSRNNGNLPTSGVLDEVRMLNQVMSPAEISTQWNNFNSPSTFYSVGSQETISVLPSTYAYSRKITVNSSQVAANETNFAMWVAITDPLLKSIANGGHVYYNDGRDIIFTSVNDPLGTSKLNFERVYYDPVGGTFKAWVRVSTISSSVNTIIWLMYGNSLIMHDQQSVRKTWIDYQEVFHMNSAVGFTNGGANEDSQLRAAKGGDTAASESPTLSTSVFKLHGSWLFNGDRVLFLNPYDNQTATPITFTAWVRMITTSSRAFYAKGTIVGGGGTDYHRLGTDSTGKLAIRSNAALQLTGTTVLSNNTWHYVAFVLRNTGVYEIYINGALEATDSGNPTSWSTDNDKNPTLGQMRSGSDSMNGYIEEARFYVAQPAGTRFLTEYRNQNSPATFYTLDAETPAGGGGGWVIFGDEGLIA
jgi:hypothetical protein